MGSEVTNIGRTLYQIFVYGTLKRGEPNFPLLADVNRGYSEFVNAGRTVKKYPLVIASKYNIPFLLSKENVGHRITGEIYRVDEMKLMALDVLENHPAFYTRRLEPIEVSVSGVTVIEFCWTYFLNEARLELLQLPFLENYNSMGDHKLPYVESEQVTSVEEMFE